MLSLLLVLICGCLNDDYNARVFHPWGCEDAREFRARLDGSRNVLLVRIEEDHWEDHAPPRYSLYRARGTVVRVFKGDWNVPETIAMERGLDDRAPSTPKTSAGSLRVVLTDLHTSDMIQLEPGDSHPYIAEYRPALEHVFPSENSQ